MLLRTPLALLLLVLLSLSLSGCLFDHPLTEVSSTNIDTRLLGVFEFKDETKTTQKKAGTTTTTDTTTINRVAVLPLDNSHYVIYYRDSSKRPPKTSKYIGWISRVDTSYFLTFRDETEGSGTFGKYGFFKFDWEFPGNILLSTPDLHEVDTAASPYELRVAVRKGLKAGTLFPYATTWWRKIARVWWNPMQKAEGVTLPPEFENGTKLLDPGL